MRTVETAAINDSLPIDRIQSVLREHSVRFAALFGSHATGTPHSESDIDIAVELETTQRDDPAYNEAFFGLSADLSDTLETDDVDLVDVHVLSPAVAEAVFEHGVLLVGDQTHAAELRNQVADSKSEELSPRDRFNTALAKIDEHLGGTAVTATDGPRDDG
ncbi:nucleotidyltransferase [Haladaptatus sp. R4]|uniref:type VII toxin-antitoxin system MntA family adenylyltransferase antitoxin n=1 Tax=Haladaptatus sp. R4 TaxID=1679489 RepID=UPI0007B48AD8|nr:nucleotidyltransferase domain-containing protein [Haladaptatus sp. R4]KZN24677.1 nucleotidyltransferase [Haladaptatus sp. R4]